MFENLKPRLDGVWDSLTDCDERTYTSVVVPSMTLDQRELKKLVGAPFYEERLLLLLIRLRNPRAHMVYVTSQPVHPMILEYYLNLLTGIPASHARGAPDDAVRARFVAAIVDGEDPRAAASDSADPVGDPGPVPRLHDGLQLDAARAQAVGPARRAAERSRSEAVVPGHEVGKPEDLPSGRRRSSGRC